MCSAPTSAHVDPTVSGLVVFSLINTLLFRKRGLRLRHLLERNVACFASGTDFVELAVIFGIEEAVKEAQNGGSGVVIYFRKEGRALGEVTKVRKQCNSTVTTSANSGTVP